MFVGYCSSDAFLGSLDTTDAGIPFNGRRIFATVLNTLVTEHGLGADQEQVRIVVGGCGSGGVGAAVLVNSVEPFLVAQNIQNYSIAAVVDSAYWMMNYAPASNATASLAAQTQAAYGQYNVTLALPNSCVKAAGLAGAWRCIAPQYSMQFISVPYLLVAPQFDKLQRALPAQLAARSAERAARHADACRPRAARGAQCGTTWARRGRTTTTRTSTRTRRRW